MRSRSEHRVSAGQTDARLAAVARYVRRHLEHAHRRPPRASQRAAAEALWSALARAPAAPVILDAGCGTGLSTRRLARRFRDAIVVGVDRSAHRLARARPLPTNAALVRADLEDLLPACERAGVRFDRVFLLYPNPYPKPGQLGRRLYARPLLPVLVRSARALELRTNWRVYAEEFAHAAALVREHDGARARPRVVAHDVEGAPLSPFEAKYHDRGHALWRVRLAPDVDDDPCNPRAR